MMVSMKVHMMEFVVVCDRREKTMSTMVLTMVSTVQSAVMSTIVST